MNFPPNNTCHAVQNTRRNHPCYVKCWPLDAGPMIMTGMPFSLRGFPHRNWACSLCLSVPLCVQVWARHSQRKYPAMTS
jgi:hypothetical protein